MRRIALLTSGGDTPGMNAAIYAVVKSARNYGIEVLGVMKGYCGLLEGRLAELRGSFVEGCVSHGGTILKTGRSEEMKTEEGLEKAVRVLKAFGVEGLVVIGGDGSLAGAKDLCDRGIPTIGLPGTIDNDLAYTDYTIGYDTAVNCVLGEISKIRDTMNSHERIGVVEVMGNKSGDIALMSGIAGEAEYILVPEVPFDVDDICEGLKQYRIKGHNTSIIVMAEAAGKGKALADYIRSHTGLDTKAIVLGYVQRGGAPSGKDRLMAIQMGIRAVELLQNGEAGRVVGIRDNQIYDCEIGEALQMKKHFNQELYDQYCQLSKI